MCVFIRNCVFYIDTCLSLCFYVPPMNLSELRAKVSEHGYKKLSNKKKRQKVLIDSGDKLDATLQSVRRWYLLLEQSGSLDPMPAEKAMTMISKAQRLMHEAACILEEVPEGVCRPRKTISKVRDVLKVGDFCQIRSDRRKNYKGILDDLESERLRIESIQGRSALVYVGFKSLTVPRKDLQMIKQVR